MTTGACSGEAAIAFARDGPLWSALGQATPAAEEWAFHGSALAAQLSSGEASVPEELDRVKQTFGEQHKQTWTLAQREEEVRELQKGLSDMQAGAALLLPPGLLTPPSLRPAARWPWRRCAPAPARTARSTLAPSCCATAATAAADPPESRRADGTARPRADAANPSPFDVALRALEAEAPAGCAWS